VVIHSMSPIRLALTIKIFVTVIALQSAAP